MSAAIAPNTQVSDGRADTDSIEAIINAWTEQKWLQGTGNKHTRLKFHEKKCLVISLVTDNY